MWASLKKLGHILQRADVIKLARLLLLVSVMVLFEMLGIFSVLPFMQVVADPEIIETNRWLKWVYETLGFSSRRSMLTWMGMIIIGIYAVTAVVNIIINWMIYKTIWGIGHGISMRLLHHYIRLPFQFFLVNNSAELVKKIISDIQALVSGVLMAGCQFISNGFKSIVILLMLFVIDPVLAMIAFATYGGTYIFIHAARHKYLTKLGRDRLHTISVRMKAFNETLTGIKTLRVSGSTPWFVNRFEKASQQFSDIQPRFQMYNLVPRHVIEFMAFGGIIGLIVFFLVTERELLGVLPTLSVFAMATYKLLPALSQAFRQAALLSHSIPVIDTVYEDMEQDQELVQSIDDASAIPPMDFRKGIRLENVSFRYNLSEMPVLKDIKLEIRKGSKCAIVGSTGCGKSTLVDIIVGLLIPAGGKLLVDDEPIDQDNVVSWQKNIAYVPQDVFLYDDTVAANIALGTPADQIDEGRLEQAAKLAQVDQFVRNELDQGFQTLVGERGVRLSGGQRQRIGLARAFYRQPAVLFLDEATSALDSITEDAIISAVDEEMPQLTLIMVAHRLTSTRFCNQIFLLDAGQLVDRGTYTELCDSNRLFRQMVEVTG